MSLPILGKVLKQQLTVTFGFKVQNYENLKSEYMLQQTTNSKTMQYILSEKFSLGDNFLLHVNFYPIGHDINRPGMIALYVYISERNCKKNAIMNQMKDNTVNISIKIGEKERCFTATIAKIMEGGLGYTDFVSQEYFQKYPMIEICVKMEKYQEINDDAKKDEFGLQLLKVFNNCMVDGDIDIIVKSTDNSNCKESTAELLETPPFKKRKLSNINNNENEIKSDDDNIMKMSGILLKSASPVFDAMLNTNNSMVEQQTKSIVIYSDSMEDVRDMFYFICTNNLKISANAARILALAHYYELKNLMIVCSGRLLEELSVETFASVMKTFEKYEISEGYQMLMDYAKAHANELKERPEFNDLSFNIRMWWNSSLID